MQRFEGACCIQGTVGICIPSSWILFLPISVYPPQRIGSDVFKAYSLGHVILLLPTCQWLFHYIRTQSKLLVWCPHSASVSELCLPFHSLH